MIITRTPFRISFFGGGTDYPEWFSKNSGSVISTTIDKYCYINLRRLPPFFNYKFRLRYFKKEEVKKISQIKHPSIRESLNFMNMSKNGGLEKGAKVKIKWNINDLSILFKARIR